MAEVSAGRGQGCAALQVKQSILAEVGAGRNFQRGWDFTGALRCTLSRAPMADARAARPAACSFERRRKRAESPRSGAWTGAAPPTRAARPPSLSAASASARAAWEATAWEAV